MPRDVYSTLMKMLRSVPKNEQNKIAGQIMAMLRNERNESTNCNDMVKEHMFKSEKPDCPHWKAQASLGCVVKKGFKDGVQRYMCKSCGRIFVATTKTVFERTRKGSDVWEKYISMTIGGSSIKACADECGLCIQTAFVWRHKILNAFKVHQEKTHLSGTIEMDEMLVPISYKGNHIPGGFNTKRTCESFGGNNLPRPSFKRGTDNKSTSSNDKACVCCMIRNGNEGFYAAVPGTRFMKEKMLDHTVGKHISKEDSIVIVDQYALTKKYLENNGFKYLSLLSNITDNQNDHKPEIQGEYHLQHVNAFLMHLRKFLAHYCRVSSKYLENYVSLYIWLKNINATKNSKQLKRISITKMVVTEAETTIASVDPIRCVRDTQDEVIYCGKATFICDARYMDEFYSHLGVPADELTYDKSLVYEYTVSDFVFTPETLAWISKMKWKAAIKGSDTVIESVKEYYSQISTMVLSGRIEAYHK